MLWLCLVVMASSRGSLYRITGASRSIACRTAGTRSYVSPARSCTSSPQCDMKSPLCKGSEHIASWITRHDRFWKTGETGGEDGFKRGAQNAYVFLFPGSLKCPTTAWPKVASEPPKHPRVLIPPSGSFLALLSSSPFLPNHEPWRSLQCPG